MKLEIKYLAPYLPYELKAIYNEENEENTVVKILGTCILDKERHYQIKFKDGVVGLFIADDIKPILRPLSDLVKVIECEGKYFIPYEDSLLADSMDSNNDLKYLCVFEGDVTKYTTISYLLIKKLIKWHFDVFGLIENGLAIDINTLNNVAN